MDLTDSQIHDLLREEFKTALADIIEDHTDRERPRPWRERETLELVATDFMEEYQEALAQGNPRIIASKAEASLREAGYKVDTDSPRFKAFCRQYLRASMELMEAYRDILNGKSAPDEVSYLDTTQFTTEQPQTETTPSPLLSEVMEKYCLEKMKAGSWKLGTKVRSSKQGDSSPAPRDTDRHTHR